MPDQSQADQYLTEEAVGLVGEWLAAAGGNRRDRAAAGRLRRLLSDSDGTAFTMGFADRVIRPERHRAAARQLRSLVVRRGAPAFLSAADRVLLAVGARLAPLFPGAVMPLARRRMRKLVGHLLAENEPDSLRRAWAAPHQAGFARNVNLLGEAVLGEEEADRRLEETARLISRPEIDYVSVKASAVVPQLNYWDWEGSRLRVLERLRLLLRRAAAASPPAFLNLDMEEYHDLELTISVFRDLLDEPEFLGAAAGIVLQAYLPDSDAALRELTEWAVRRREAGGAEIKIRLVKGANLAMERVEAVMRGWEQAPYPSKAEVDANYKRLVDYALRPERTRAVRIGIGSHNLFDLAWAHLLSRERGVADRVDFEMLQGMAPALSRVVKETAPGGVLLYTPVVARETFDTAISYLFRRLEENSTEGNFLRAMFHLAPDSAEFHRQAEAFRAAVRDREAVSDRPRRWQERPAPAAAAHDREVFTNEPDTDPALAGNREWADRVRTRDGGAVRTPAVGSADELGAIAAAARRSSWRRTPPARRRETLHQMADLLARRRGDLISAMVWEGRKTFAEADPEVSEAIDFARYYGDRALDLEAEDGAAFEPLPVIAVVPPWNFPTAIPAGGTAAALAAGASVLLKPSRRTRRCAEIMAECAWEAGVPRDALAFLTLPRGEEGERASRRLVEEADGLILTGSEETARLFASWRPELRLFAETSGKNCMVITEHADLDQAVADLVDSAFGHSGQKCSAASLAVCVGGVYRSERFRRQLRDAVLSLAAGPAAEAATVLGPVIAPVDGKLERALTRLEPGEEWLVAPQRLDEEGSLWRPGIRWGVAPGSWFHLTECFGPALGVMHAPNLEAALEIQNAVAYGLTGGIHTLDPQEADFWLERAQVGNAYVNRGITGAIVQRQPFGGWKLSNVGPGAKAGGPNYVRQLGEWRPDGSAGWEAAPASDARWWEEHYSREHDPSGLFCESNIFRYRPLDGAAVRAGEGSREEELERTLAAARRCGTPVSVSSAAEESQSAFAARVGRLGAERVRMVGEEPQEELRRACREANVHLIEAPVTPSGRVELAYYLKEQTVSRTLHRFGNLVGA